MSMNRQEYKAAKELEEARKAGTAPPAVDSDGNIINPHIPEYISRAPWYAAPSTDEPSLRHQRNHNAAKRNYDGIGAWVPRARFKGPAATKYRKGACKNCGSATHTSKTCVERPRRRGASVTGSDIQPDEVTGSVNLDFVGKRDRWNGYDINEFTKVSKRYTKLENARRQNRLLQNDNKDKGDGEKDEDAEGVKEGTIVQETGEAAKTTVRNLRIREDTAKYLYNLDLNSAYYDPKSRSMRADPLAHDENKEDKDFLGDNFVTQSEDVRKLAQMNLLAIDAKSHAVQQQEEEKDDEEERRAAHNVPHIQAEPSRAEAVFKSIEANKSALQQRINSKIMDKYGQQSNYTSLNKK